MNKYFTRTLSIVLVVLMALSVCVNKSVNVAAASESAMNFSDVVQDKWYYKDVEFVFTKSLMNGVSTSTFEPGSPCTRGMLVTILYRLEGSPTVSKNYFIDVPENKYYTNATSWALINGIVTGYGDGRFGPMDNVTRQQLAAILCRYSKFRGDYVEYNQDISIFSDTDSISSYAVEDIKWAYHEGIIKGMTETTFAPKENATRAQIAAMLHRFYCAFFDYYNVTFKWNCRVGDTYFTNKVKPGELVLKPDDPVRFGYRMTGWYLDDKATQKYLFTEKIENNLTLYAGWELVDLAQVESKYDYDKNPLVNKTISGFNKEVLPSFDIDQTNFVKSGIKLSDLNGKTLAFFTANNTPSFVYYNKSGEAVDEWNWFKQLKAELGINIHYTISSYMQTLARSLQYINAGKQLDIIQTNSAVFTSAATLSRSLDGLVNFDGATNSLGVCTNTMNVCRWQNTPRVVAPLGTVDVLWYNQTMSAELGLRDPRTSWKNGQWNFDSFINYLESAPATTKDGKELIAFAQPAYSLIATWTATNGLNLFGYDTDSVQPSIINNWDDPKAVEVLDSLSKKLNLFNFSYFPNDLPKIYDGTLLMASSLNNNLYNYSEYAKKIQIHWVPYPKFTSVTGVDICAYNGTYMMLPKKTAKPDNVDIALKFMELWANRYTEATYDNLCRYEYYSFNNKQKKEYFSYVVNNAAYPVGIDSFIGINMSDFYKGLFGNPAYNVKFQMEAISQQVKTKIAESLAYGDIIQ